MDQLPKHLFLIFFSQIVVFGQETEFAVDFRRVLLRNFGTILAYNFINMTVLKLTFERGVDMV